MPQKNSVSITHGHLEQPPIMAGAREVFFSQLQLRTAKLFRMLKKRPLSVGSLEAYWSALWVVAEAHAEQWRAATASAVASSSQKRPGSSSSSMLNGSSNAKHDDEPPVTNQRLKVVVVPKLFSLNFSAQCHRRKVHHSVSASGTTLQEGRPPTPAVGGALFTPLLQQQQQQQLRKGGGTALPVVFFELSNEFQRSRGIPQSLSSVFHTNGIPERVIELSSREVLDVARAIAAPSMSSSLPDVRHAAPAAHGSLNQLQPPSFCTLDEVSAEDVSAISRIVGDAIVDVFSNSEVRGDIRLACGTTGELRLCTSGGRKTITFSAWNTSASSEAGAFDMPRVHQMTPQRRGGGHLLQRPTSSASSVSGAAHVLSIEAASVAKHQRQPPAALSESASSLASRPAAHGPVEDGGGAGDGSLLDPAVAASRSFDDSNAVVAPELRKYIHQSSSRPSSRQSNLSTLSSLQHQQQLLNHRPTQMLLSSLPPRPSSQCSSLGPSASEVHSSTPPHFSKVLPPQHIHHQSSRLYHEAPGASSEGLQRSKHRREMLDNELAEIQRTLETRLGMTSAMSVIGGNSDPAGPHHHHRHDSPARASSPASFNASTSSKRSATALAYYSAVPDENRHPAQDRRELVMHHAVMRHRDIVRAQELDEAKMDAVRGAKETQAILARVDTELLRRANAEQLTNDLNAQKYFHSLRRDGRGRMVGEVETSIMRPPSCYLHGTPSPQSPASGASRRRDSNAVPSTSVAALGSDPASVVQEKRAERAKRRAYGADLDTLNAALAAARETQQKQSFDVERQLLEDNAIEIKGEKDRLAFKKASFRHHYVEAWDMQRRIANSPSSQMMIAATAGGDSRESQRQIESVSANSN